MAQVNLRRWFLGGTLSSPSPQTARIMIKSNFPFYQHCLFQVLIFFFFAPFFVGGDADPTAYGDSQARGPIGATATGLHHSHSTARSKLHLQPTPQITATPDP